MTPVSRFYQAVEKLVAAGYGPDIIDLFDVKQRTAEPWYKRTRKKIVDLYTQLKNNKTLFYSLLTIVAVVFGTTVALLLRRQFKVHRPIDAKTAKKMDEEIKKKSPRTEQQFDKAVARDIKLRQEEAKRKKQLSRQEEKAKRDLARKRDLTRGPLPATEEHKKKVEKREKELERQRKFEEQAKKTKGKSTLEVNDRKKLEKIVKKTPYVTEKAEAKPLRSLEQSSAALHNLWNQGKRFLPIGMNLTPQYEVDPQLKFAILILKHFETGRSIEIIVRPKLTTISLRESFRGAINDASELIDISEPIRQTTHWRFELPTTKVIEAGLPAEVWKQAFFELNLLDRLQRGQERVKQEALQKQKIRQERRKRLWKPTKPESEFVLSAIADQIPKRLKFYNAGMYDNQLSLGFNPGGTGQVFARFTYKDRNLVAKILETGQEMPIVGSFNQLRKKGLPTHIWRRLYKIAKRIYVKAE
jgi:hypothetical protein